MEITNEIKKVVLAMYLGQKASIQLKGTSDIGYEDGINTLDGFLLDWQDELEYLKVNLKPITEITDEDAIEMAKIFGGVDGEIMINRPTDVTNKDIYFVIQIFTNKPSWTTYSIPKEWGDNHGTSAYQYLASKGYDLPHYLLGGKTLYESGLAIYSNG